MVRRKAPFKLDNLLQICSTKGFSYVGFDYVTSKGRSNAVITFICRFGITHTQTRTSLLKPKYGCGCAVVSSYEHAVRTRLEFFTGKPWSHTPKRVLRQLFQMGETPHEFDCYNHELKVAFEVDGEFHFETDRQDIQKNDVKRNLWAQANNVRLIRIFGPNLRTLTESEKTELILDILSTHHIPHDNTKQFNPVPLPSKQEMGLKKLHALGISTGWKFLDKTYAGMRTKYAWACPTHQEFYATADKIQGGAGCPKCARRGIDWATPQEVREWCERNRIRSMRGFIKAKRPENFPSNLSQIYGISLSWFFGTRPIGSPWPDKDLVREACLAAGIRSQAQYRAWKHKGRPKEFPANLQTTYGIATTWFWGKKFGDKANHRAFRNLRNS